MRRHTLNKKQNSNIFYEAEKISCHLKLYHNSYEFFNANIWRKSHAYISFPAI